MAIIAPTRCIGTACCGAIPMDPSRFLPGAASTIDRFAFPPFGVGPRMCLGATFAVREVTLVLAALARDFEFELAPWQSVWPIVDFTMKPRDGLRMDVRKACTQASLRATK